MHLLEYSKKTLPKILKPHNFFSELYQLLLESPIEPDSAFMPPPKRVTFLNALQRMAEDNRIDSALLPGYACAADAALDECKVRMIGEEWNGEEQRLKCATEEFIRACTEKVPSVAEEIRRKKEIKENKEDKEDRASEKRR